MAGTRFAGLPIGNSPMRPDIPALIWHNQASRLLPADLERRPFRADWGSWTLTDLLRIQWHADEPSRNVLHDDYRWLAPRLRVPVASFVD